MQLATRTVYTSTFYIEDQELRNSTEREVIRAPSKHLHRVLRI